MYRKSKPGPQRKSDMQAARSKSRLVTFRLDPEDLVPLDALVGAGYGANRTKVIRRSIAETARWALSRD